MDNLAAIRAQLVDVRNVGYNKVVKLTLHVPAELAPQVMQAFGWPTSVNPVDVAVARLDPEKKFDPNPETLILKKSQNWMLTRAAMLCKSARFRAYLQEMYNYTEGAINEEDAAVWLRLECKVKSRSEIVAGTPAGDHFDKVLNEYEEWLRGEETQAS